MLILLGDGVVANTTLNKSNFKGGGPVQITLGWGFAVMIPAIIFTNVSGSHFNPALTVALAVTGKFAWGNVLGYVAAQILGGIFGAVLVFICFKNQFDATRDKDIIRGCFCTSPAVYDKPINFICETIATFVLVFVLLCFSGDMVSHRSGVSSIYIFALISSIGMSLGGVTGYAINPARDLGPRIAHCILPIKNKGKSNWSYAWIPILGPISGGILASLVYMALF